jgi:hypothetical protein
MCRPISSNEFTEAGINQTRHDVMLAVRAQITGYIPGYTCGRRAFPRNLHLPKRSIVGRLRIPDAYTKVYDGQGARRSISSSNTAPVDPSKEKGCFKQAGEWSKLNRKLLLGENGENHNGTQPGSTAGQRAERVAG